MNYQITQLIEVCRSIVEYSNSTGCSEDLTVTSAEAVEKLRSLLAEIPSAPQVKSVNLESINKHKSLKVNFDYTSESNAGLYLEGHGTCLGGPDDCCVLIDYYNAVPMLYVWSNRREQDPTHVISLAEAKFWEGSIDCKKCWEVLASIYSTMGAKPVHHSYYFVKNETSERAAEIVLEHLKTLVEYDERIDSLAVVESVDECSLEDVDQGEHDGMKVFH